MDSTWFAVDEDGNVGIFETGLGGAMPCGKEFPKAYPSQLEEHMLLARILTQRAQTDERLRDLLPSGLSALEKRLENNLEELDDWDVVEILFRSLGVWTYYCDFGAALPYVRVGEAGRSLSIHDLDEEIRALLVDAKLPVRFGEAPLIAPGEHVPIATWSNYWVDLEGRLRPVQGLEEEFEEILARSPDFQADIYRSMKEVVPEDGKILEGDAFYETIAKLVVEPEKFDPKLR